VKNDVKGSSDTSKPSFDTLREAAEENTQSEDEREGDDTEIEVLEEGLDSRQKQKQKKREKKREKEKEKSKPDNPMMEKTSKSGSEENVSSSADMKALEEKMDRMIEQNERIIEVLESFGQ
jgi:hypothetical protein